MDLILGTTAYIDNKALIENLNQIGINVVQTFDLNTWQRERTADISNTLLLVYLTPEMTALGAINQDQSPEDALHNWKVAANNLITCFKLNRKKTTVVNWADLVISPTVVLNQLAQLSNTELATPSKPISLAESSPKKDHALELLAHFLVLKDPSLQKTFTKLHACTLPVISETTDEFDLNAFISWNQQSKEQHASLSAKQTALTKELNQLKKDQSESTKENQLLLEQLHQVQESLEESLNQLKNEKIENTKLKSVNATIEGQFNALQKTYTQLSDERNTLQNELTKKSNEFDKLNHEFSSVSEENALLLEQLHLVQEALEEHLVTSEKQTDEYQNRIHSLHAVIDGKDTELDNLKTETQALHKQLTHERNVRHQNIQQQQYTERTTTLQLATANKKIKDLEAQLSRITQNRVVRLTKPLSGLHKKEFRARQVELKSQIKEIELSGLFNADWYLDKYEDVKNANLEPIEHYLLSGTYEGRDPSEAFNTLWYLHNYPDVSESGLNPLIHYIRFGKEEERSPKSPA